jgi:hypothetical protein
MARISRKERGSGREKNKTARKQEQIPKSVWKGFQKDYQTAQGKRREE